ncbi:MAG TPA: PQQ-binding-like beta-propeller repeat protein [Phycisphaerae bacterium]|jgi:outer membrane protein assembly factor BamB|nr:PQQ-binding-like beta-propeller repeat protein [Phycisphaerae bacterium]HOB73756.1 PQQ-binding-like beta-propeller repeat protein [Phycisphaerae bacterium]HOJ53370.1 PQQ-binding-like beta-propeller repeat protein [Phycisphaerae bacterium]HOL25506.1 PQQ-binding-like beta-propeller repeat protein [Phycisphaerae bacterium]HPP19817.1 PQQ-binding-like beta-propeller repeat protein [Phycisphaerae bacterium]
MFRRILCVLVSLQASAVLAAPATQPAQPAPRSLTMRGVVFEDLNANGVRNDGEPALAGMSVSDGLTVLKTSADGAFQFELNEVVRGSVFVSTPAGWRPSKKFFVVADFDRYAGGVQPADIGLVRAPERNTDRFTFVQLTDTHVTQAEDAVRTMIEDLEVVNRLSDRPMFIVTTGDLTNTGKEIPQLEAYVKATRRCRYPIYNTVGNHDWGGQFRESENYERYLGPPYYSFDIGPYHFISRDIVAIIKNKSYHQRQEKWIEEDLRINGAGKRVIVLQHYIPTIPELDWWAERNCAAIFSGHWHGRRERIYKGILDINSSTLRFGGIDRSPRGFRIIHVDGDQMRCEWRVGGQRERLEIVHPPLDGSVAGREIPLRVLAYDTAVKAKKARWRILDAAPEADNRVLADGNLWIESSWSWAGRWQVPPGVASGPKRIEIQVTAADGKVWTKEGVFTLTGGPTTTVKPGEAWPFFHNDAGHRGYLPTGPKPPLSLAWATSLGGNIHISSPVIAEGKVYAATSFEQSMEDCAVVALDLVTGRELWRATVDSSIKHSLAVWDGNIMAVSQAGTLYCFNRDGYPRWTTSLGREQSDRWELSFPVTDGKAVYAGRCAGFGAYDLATGERLWRQPGGKDWWPNVYSGPSIGTGTIYQGGPFVRALDPEKGEIRWAKAKMSVSTVAVVPAAVEAGQEGDRLYVFHTEKTLRCLDGKTGEQIWEATFDKPTDKDSRIVPLGNETGTPAIGEYIVCVGSAEVNLDGKTLGAAMHGFDKATGKLKWRFPIGKDLASSIPYRRDAATITSSPVIVGDVVYFGASDGYFYALDAREGALLWKYWFGLPIASTPAISGNTIIVATWDGTIYALAGVE